MVLAPVARQDIRDTLRWSQEKFGQRAAGRYQALLTQALRDIEADPERAGSRDRPEIQLAGARTYHLALSRDRVAGQRVRTPRHFLLYWRRRDGVIVVARVLHDSMDLSRHVLGTLG